MVTKKTEAEPETIAQQHPQGVAAPALEAVELSSTLDEAALEQRIFVEVIATLAGRGVPAKEAAAIAREYAQAGVEAYGDIQP